MNGDWDGRELWATALSNWESEIKDNAGSTIRSGAICGEREAVLILLIITFLHYL